MLQIPEQILTRSSRLLYMTPLALGDFLYQSCFLRQIKQQYPQLSIDIWFDDLRTGTKDWHQGRNRTLSQWLEAVDYIDQVYPIPENAAARDLAVKKAQHRGYDVVLFLAKSRVARYEKYARLLAPKGFVAGIAASKERFKRMFFGAKPDLLLPMESFRLTDGAHISEFYAHFFSRLFNLKKIDLEPSLEIPDLWLQRLATQFSAAKDKGRKLVLINYLSTNRSHDLSLEAVFFLIKKMRDLQPGLEFVLCVPPHELAATENAIQNQGSLPDCVRAFTAKEHFFELPALIAYADFVLSVDTSVVHFASALGRPLVSLMRSNNLQWRPLANESTCVVLAPDAKWVKDIPPDAIIAACAGQGFFKA